MRRRIVLAFLLALPWMAVTYSVSILFQMAILGDQCDTGETTVLFNLFYDMSSSNGYHPWPSTFNFVITVFVPAISLGYVSAKRLDRKKV